MTSLVGIRLSHSTMEVVHTCERKFQLDKLLTNGMAKDDTPDTVFGKAYGVGVAEYFVSQDKDLALYKCWEAYYPIMESEKKNEVKCYNALMHSFSKIDTLLEEYEVVYFRGKPAVELSFALTTDTKYYFVGYIDIVLKNKLTGKYVVLDAKTTGLQLEDLSPVYKNSPQLIGYSIAMDAIVGEEQAEYEVMYLVAQMTQDGFSPKIHSFKYAKTLLDRLTWFITLGIDIEHLERMEALDVYPKRGNACLHYNRPCKYFGVCNLHSLDMPKPLEEDTTEYDFYFSLQDLIDNHVSRIQQHTQSLIGD